MSYNWDEYEQQFVDSPVYELQAQTIISVLDRLSFRSVLEVGPGFGRITQLVLEKWPDVRYRVLDVSQVLIDSAKRRIGRDFDDEIVGSIQEANDLRPSDLVLAIELLMHVPPTEIEQAITNVLAAARRAVVTVDWSEPYEWDMPTSDFNWLHDYEKLFVNAGGRVADTIRLGQQTLYLVRPSR